MGRHSLLAVIVCVAALVTGCAAQDRATAAAGDRLTVVATTTQLADFTRNVGGDRVEVTSILKPGVDSHDYDPSPADIDLIARAPVLVVNGVGLEGWLDATLEAAGFDGTLVDTSRGVPLLAGPEDAHAHEHAEEPAEGADEHAAGEEHGEAGEGGHEHGPDDPHIWQDPRNAVIMVRNIERALAAADPDGAATYKANADAYVRELEKLDAEVEARLATLTNRKLVTLHEAFTYYAHRYDLEFVGAVIPSFDTAAELSAHEISELADTIRQTGVKAVFSETTLPPETAQTVASEAGVEVVTGDEALYGDSLGPAGSAGATYVGAIRHNTDSIATHLG